MEPLTRRYFEAPTLEVAEDLIGHFLVNESGGQRLVGRIVETEAYREDDPACHAWSSVRARGGRVPENWRGHVLRGEPGLAYIYLNYGMYWLLNVVTEPPGIGAAVLIRAVEPVEGIDIMRLRRAVSDDRELTNGPGKLTVAFGIDSSYHKHPLTESPLYLARAPRKERLRVEVSRRIGITKGADLPWRYYLSGSKFVSRAG